MRKREIFGEIIAKVPHPRRNCPRPKDMLLSKASDEQSEAHGRKRLQKLIAPQMHAFRSRRSVAATRAAGIAETHRQDGDALFVVKFIARQARPFTQPVSRRIGEGYACPMHFRAGSLARDEDGRARRQLQDRPRTQRQCTGASAASPHLRQQCGKRFRAALLASLHPQFLSHNCFYPDRRVCR